MDSKKECFILDELPREKAFLTLKLRKAGSNVSFFKIFNKFIDDDDVPKTGEWRGMHNPRTGERFVYHYDTQKGVGIKYNYAYGFDHCLVLNTIKQHSNRIPCYDNYKTFFEACDRFNRNLHDRYFPHKRGGKGRSGEDGEHNDFIMACILQNTFNAYHHINNVHVGSITFKEMCDSLSDDIFSYSMNY